MEESKNPFEAFGGQEVVDTDKDPFSAFGGVEVKKKAESNASKSGLPSSASGLNLSPSSLTNLSSQTELSPVTDPKLRQSIIQQQNTPDAPDTGAQRLLDKLSPSERANMLAFNKIASAKPKDELTAPTAEERAHQDFMQTNTGKALGAVAYLGSKATKGTLQVLKGAAHLAGGLSALPSGETATDQAFNMLDKASDYGLAKSDIANQESGKSGKALSALGMAAEFAPAVATGEALNAPKSLMYLQGVGQGKELADNLENNGTKLNPIAKEALIQGTGAVNLLLTDIFKGAKVSSSLQDKVTTGIAADALKESAGKDISVDSFKELLQKKAQDFAGKFERAPAEILKHYNETAKTFTKLNVGNFALHKAVDELNDKPVFNETLGDLAGNEQKALTQDAPIFSAVPAVGELTKLLPNSGYRNEVVDAVMKDPSPENIDQIKDKIYNHGFNDGNPNKWSPEEMDATFQHVDKIADAARALPRDISENKRDKAVGLVLDRNELQGQLKSLQEAKKSLDPSIQDIPTAKEQYLTDKIEQANDKLRDIVKGSRTTYSKERDDKGQETGKFLKKADDAVEEITPTRYDLERTERDARESNNNQIKNEPTEPLEAVDPSASQITTPETEQINETPITPDKLAPENQEPDNKISVGEILDKPITYQGEPAVVYKDGQSLVAKINGSNREYELGNADEISEHSIKDYGIEHENSVVSSNEKGNIVVRDKEYVNNYSDPKAAISHDKNGNVVSVSLETPEGKKRTFKGDVAEDIAYQIHLKELNKENGTAEEFEQFVEQNEPTKSAIVARENEVATEKGAGSVDAKVSRKPAVKKRKIDEQTTIVKEAKSPISADSEASGKKQTAVNDAPTKVSDTSKGEQVQVRVDEKIPVVSESKAGDPLRSFATKVREGKINRLGGFKASTGFDGVWDASLEVVAKTLEGGAKVADAIEAGLKHVKGTDWYKSLSDKENFDTQYRNHLKSEYDEHEESERQTSIKNDTVTEERQQRGLPEVERLAKRSFPEVYEKAKEAILKNEIDPRSLAEYVSKNPRSLTPEETVALALDRMKLSNEHVETVERLKDAYAKDDMDAVGALEHRLSQLEKQTEYNDEASTRGGYEQALALAVRRLIIKEDYTYLNKLNEAKAVNGGKDIPAEAKAKIDELTTKLQDNIKRQEELENQVAKLKAERDTKRQAGTVKPRESKSRASLKEDLNDILSDFKKEFKQARKSSTLKSDIPYRQELFAASKFILRVSKRLVEEGITDVAEIASQVKDLFKDDIDGINERDVYDVLSGKYSKAKPTKSEIAKELEDIKKQASLIAQIEDAERGLKKDPKTSIPVASEKTQALRDKLKYITKNDVTLEQAKKRATKRQSELQEMLKTGNYNKSDGFKTQYDYEYNKIKAINEKLKRQIDGEIYKIKQQNRTSLEKSLDYVNAYRRAALLSRIGTLFKLGAAATERLITTPAEEGVGSLLNKIPGLRKIADQAPREGEGFTLKSEAAAFADTFSKNTLTDIGETIKHGHGSLDYAHGRRIPVQVGGFEGAMEFPGKLHGAIKIVPKRNEFFRAFEKRVEFAKKQGLDVDNPLVLESIQADAYKDAQRSIFMNDNLLTDTYRHAINSLENSKNPNTRTRNKIAASIMKYMLPIVKVPTNFALETTNYVAGAARALPHIIKAATQGAESLTPEQSDFVLRALKKNSVGLALLAIGYYNPKAIGGYYQEGEKRKDNDAQVGDVNVFGVHLPHFLLHAPALEVLQVGATLRRVKDKYERKHHGKSGTWAGSIASAGGIASDIPFFDAPRRIGDAIKSEKGAEYYLGEQAKDLLVPGLVQEISDLTDKKSKESFSNDPVGYIMAKPNKRKMDGIGDHIQNAIPGWRNMLPKKKK